MNLRRRGGTAAAGGPFCGHVRIERWADAEEAARLIAAALTRAASRAASEKKPR